MIGKNDFFEDVASALDHWTSVAVESVTNPLANLAWVDEEMPFRKLASILKNSGAAEEDVHQIFGEVLRGLTVSLLTVLDGGTALADQGERVYLVDLAGEHLGEGLHDDFLGYLLSTGRLK